MRFGLKHVRHFVAVAEELHFRRAAERLGIAQPTLSRSVRFLEREMNVSLFTRSNRNVEITPAGTTFLRGCRNILNCVEHTVEDTRLVHKGLFGSVRIGYTDNAIIGALPSLLKDFQAEHSGVVLQIHHDVTAAQLLKLDDEELDIGFVTGPINRSGFEQCFIQSERFVCIVHENHKLAKRKSVRLEELAKEDFVHGLSKDWEHFYSYLIPFCRRAGFVPGIVQEAFNTAGILGLVACGMGITILTENVRNSIGSGLAIIPIEDVSEQLQNVAIWKADTMHGSKELFVNYLRCAVNAGQRPGDQGISVRH